MPLDMPPPDTASAIEEEKEAPKIIIQQEEEESTEAVLAKLMAKEGAAFAPKMEIKKANLANPDEAIVDEEIRRNLEENDQNILKNADKDKPGRDQLSSAF
jgi:hypothetical protein